MEGGNQGVGFRFWGLGSWLIVWVWGLRVWGVGVGVDSDTGTLKCTRVASENQGMVRV